jgi:hypothetical protein
VFREVLEAAVFTALLIFFGGRNLKPGFFFRVTNVLEIIFYIAYLSGVVMIWRRFSIKS